MPQAGPFKLMIWVRQSASSGAQSVPVVCPVGSVKHHHNFFVVTKWTALDQSPPFRIISIHQSVTPLQAPRAATRQDLALWMTE